MADSRPATDRAMFEDLYRNEHDRLHARFTGIVGDRDRADDIVAAAFQTAWEKRAQFRGESSLGTWLHAIALNAARRSWRQERHSHRDPVDRIEMYRDAEADRRSSRFEEDELRTLLAKALDRIPAKYRRLLVHRYVSGLSLHAIARRDGVPVGTVGSRLFTANRLLRGAWQNPAAIGRAVQEESSRQIADEAAKRLVTELQAGRSAALMQYLAAMSRFHHYSWNNVLLIQTQRPDATRVAGYHTWQRLGRWVKQSERGILIIAPLVTKSGERDLTPSNKAVERPEPTKLAGFRTAFVFDVKQTDGRPLPALARTGGDPKDFGDKLKAIVAQRGIALTYDASIAPADGLSSGGSIRLRPGLSPAEEFSVLAHELAHELLHHGPERGDLPRVVRETQAEAVAFVVSRAIGLETRSAAADYIALYNGDAKTLTDSLATIQETASHILGDLLPDERVPATADRRSVTSTREPSGTTPKQSDLDRIDSPTLNR